MKRSPSRFLLALVVLLFAPPLAPAAAPSGAPAPASDTASFASQKSAFLALPEATRKAAQDALVWLGLYNGSNDGEFGKRTRDSIVAFQLSQKAPGDGVLSAAQLQALLSAADKARASAGFGVVDDPKTGARIGSPAKLMGKQGAKLDFGSSANADLAALYARLSAETPTRKLAYKAMKPGAFFVVSGQDGPAKFYSRFEASESASPPIRGFTFAYPAAQAAQLDRVALAVANSFEAFPVRTQTAAAPAPAAGAANPATPEPKPPTPAPAASATALVVRPGEAVTALKPEDCANASIGGKPVSFARTDPVTGLAILSGDFGSNGKPPTAGALAHDLVVLSESGEQIVANSASLAGDASRPLVVASLEKSASGGPAFDRQGGLAGLVAPIANEPKRVGGLALAEPHPLIVASAVGAFLGGGELAPASAVAPLSAGVIAAREKDAAVPVFCGK